MKDNIKEIRIKRVKKLSSKAQEEVMAKLHNLPGTFDFRGYAKVSYAGTPLGVVQIDPIEGDILNEFDRINNMIAARN